MSSITDACTEVKNEDFLCDEKINFDDIHEIWRKGREYEDSEPKKITKNCGQGYYYNEKTGKIVRFFCARRGCDRKQCRRRYARKIKALVFDLVKEYALNYFFTLTLDPALIVGKDSETYIKHVWANCSRMIRRKYPGIKFVWVIERQTNGNAHIHGFWSRRVDVVWLRKSWQNCGGGCQVRLRYVGSEKKKIACYLTKYIGKCVSSYRADKAGKLQPFTGRVWGRSTNMETKYERKKTGFSYKPSVIYNERGEIIVAQAVQELAFIESKLVAENLHKQIMAVKKDYHELELQKKEGYEYPYDVKKEDFSFIYRSDKKPEYRRKGPFLLDGMAVIKKQKFVVSPRVPSQMFPF